MITHADLSDKHGLIPLVVQPFYSRDQESHGICFVTVIRKGVSEAFCLIQQ